MNVVAAAAVVVLESLLSLPESKMCLLKTYIHQIISIHIRLDESVRMCCLGNGKIISPCCR